MLPLSEEKERPMGPSDFAKTELGRGSVAEEVCVRPAEEGPAKALGQMVREDDGTVASPQKKTWGACQA
eukprot:6206484-Prorocentrum_lima.AAC.1